MVKNTEEGFQDYLSSQPFRGRGMIRSLISEITKLRQEI